MPHDTESHAYDWRKRNNLKRGTEKVSTVMREFKVGELHSGSKTGPLVKSRKQAVAIALSEQRKALSDKS